MVIKDLVNSKALEDRLLLISSKAATKVLHRLLIKARLKVVSLRNSNMAVILNSINSHRRANTRSKGTSAHLR